MIILAYFSKPQAIIRSEEVLVKAKQLMPLTNKLEIVFTSYPVLVFQNLIVESLPPVASKSRKLKSTHNILFWFGSIVNEGLWWMKS